MMAAEDEHRKTIEVSIPRERIVTMLCQKMNNESGYIYGAELRVYAELMLDTVFKLKDALGVDAEITGSRANSEPLNPDSVKDRDIDIHLIPKGILSPKKLGNRLSQYLQSLPSKTVYDFSVNIEAEKEYVAFSLGLESHVALVTPQDSVTKGNLASMRIVMMQSLYPWGDPTKKDLTHENPTVKTPIIEFGFANLEGKRWVSSKEFDPTQKYVIKMTDHDTFTLVPTTPTYNAENFEDLSPKSQSVLMLRSFAVGLPIPKADLKSFKAVTGGSFHVFRYNLGSSLRKVETYIGISALTNSEFVENVLKYTHPYMYNLIKNFGPDSAAVADFFEKVREEYNVRSNLFMKVLSLAKQLQIASQNYQSGPLRDLALEEGRKIEKNMYSYEANRSAFDSIKT